MHRDIAEMFLQVLLDQSEGSEVYGQAGVQPADSPADHLYTCAHGQAASGRFWGGGAIMSDMAVDYVQVTANM